MDIYYVDIYTDMDEALTVMVNAGNASEAEASAQTMVETGQADCVGRIAVSCNAYQ